MAFYNMETWNYDAKVGDMVTGDVVAMAMDILPPIRMSADCAQLGEPYSHEFDSKAGKYRPTWYTWRLESRSWCGPGIGDICTPWEAGALWRFCGACFAGEIVNRVKIFEPTRIEAGAIA